MRFKLLGLLVSLVAASGCATAQTTRSPAQSTAAVPPVVQQTAPPAVQVPLPHAAPLNILFVGNSLTGYNDLPGLFKSLAVGAGQTPYVEVSLKFGKSIADHLADPKFLKQLKKPWDFIVVQDYSTTAQKDPKALLNHVFDLRAKAGAKPKLVLFETWPWATENRHVMTKIDATYVRSAKLSNTAVLHIGDAFVQVSDKTEIGMYVDERHPTPIASYLSALMFLKFFYRIDPMTVLQTGANQNTPSVFSGEPPAPSLFDLKTLYTPEDIAIVQAAAAKYVP